MGHFRMTYRPRIPDDVKKRVEQHTIGKRIRENQAYINAIKMLYSEDGSRAEWLMRLDKYCNNHDADRREIMRHIVKSLFNEDGEADIKFKEKLDLD